MFRLNFLEPHNVDYVYVDETTNNVYLLIPLVGGESIGIDNTCRTVLEMQKFFGKDHNATINRTSALEQLKRYRDAINTDLELLATSRSIANGDARLRKTQRLGQINHYINVLERLNASNQFGQLATALPSYPPAVHTLFREGFSNLHSMVLSPERVDIYLRTTSSTFSITRKHQAYGANFPPGLSQTLNQTFQRLVIGQRQEESTKDVLKRAVVASLEAKYIPKPREIIEEIFQEIITQLRNEFQARFHQDITFDRIKDIQGDNGNATKDNIELVCALDPSDDSFEGYIDGLLDSCVEQDVWANIGRTPSPFNSITDRIQHREKLSIIVQFFLAQVNIYCASNNISTTNFGTLLDNDSLKRANIAQLVLHQMANGTCPENGLFEFINNNHQFFRMNAPLTAVQKESIRSKFRLDYATINDSPHFDEFIVFSPEKQVARGAARAVYHQGRLCINFADFIIAGHRPEDATGFFARKQNEFRTLTTTVLPHVNQSVAGSFDFDENTAVGLLNTNQIEKLARLLTTTVLNADGSSKGIQLFQSLPQPIINQLIRHQQWNELRRATIAKLGTPEKIQQFNIKYQYADLKPSIVLSAQEVMCIENAFISFSGDRIETSERGSIDSIAAMLAIMLTSDEVVEVDLNIDGGYVVTTTQDQIDEINTIIEKNRTLFCLPAYLESRIYAAVLHRFGRESKEYLRLRTLDDNKTEKLNFAFGLLNIKAKYDHINDRDAYVFIVDPGQQEPILIICHSYESTVEEEITAEEFLKLQELELVQDTKTAQIEGAVQTEENSPSVLITTDTKPSSSTKNAHKSIENNKLSNAVFKGAITFLVLMIIFAIIIHSPIILFLTKLIGLTDAALNLGIIYIAAVPIITLISMIVSIISLKPIKSAEAKSEVVKVSINENPQPCETATITATQSHKAPLLFAHRRQVTIAPLLATTTDQEQHIIHRIPK